MIEKEKQSEEMPEQRIEIPERVEEILEVSPEIARAREMAEQEEAKKLREQIEKVLADKGVNSIEKLPNQPETCFEEKSMQRKDTSVVKKMGVLVGKSLSWAVDLLENRVKKFDIERSGAENLKELEGRPYILAANHIKPRNILMQMIGLSPDSFMIKRVVREESQRIPNAISNVSGKIKRIPIFGHTDKIWSPFREGIMEGAGFIPVKMRREGESTGFNRNFVKKFREAVDRKEPIVIFSQGHWDKDFDPEREFETGTATLARNYNLPIVPVYISGGRSWSSREKAFVSIGQIIDPAGKNKDEITDEIRKDIIRMEEVKAGDNDETENE